MNLFMTITSDFSLFGASLVAQMVNYLPAMQETQEMRVQFLDHEDHLEEEITTHSSILFYLLIYLF